MDCPDCEDSQLVVFTVPSEYRAHAPDDTAGICPECLQVLGVDGDSSASDPEFEAISQDFPRGEAGVAVALALGKLHSLALNRSAIEDLLISAEHHGVDVFTTLERLDAPNAAFALDRRRQQVSQILDYSAV